MVLFILGKFIFNFSQFISGLNATSCQLLLFYSDVVYGQNTTATPRWVGINGISQKLLDTSAALNTISQNAAAATNNNDNWTTIDPPAFEKNLSNYYSQYQNSTLPNPNPASSQNGGKSTITPLYISNYGNYTTNGSLLNIIYQNYLYQIQGGITFLKQAKYSASNISVYENQIQAQLSTASDSIQAFNATFNSIDVTFSTLVDIVNNKINF